MTVGKVEEEEEGLEWVGCWDKDWGIGGGGKTEERLGEGVGR